MPISTQDFTKGLDFTGLGTSATAAQHNQLVEQGVPTPDASADVGRGLAIVTTDSASGVPVVPDAATNTKWQRYIWIRRPHSADANQVMRAYAWNTNVTSIATYLKWSQSTVDLATLQTQIDTANTNATTALAAANTAQSAANAAQTAATNAGTSATAANNAAGAAQTTANSASSAATTAAANASAALTAANAATSAAAANIGNQRLVGYSSPFQYLRSNAAANAVEWFDPRNEIVQISNAATQTLMAGATNPAQSSSTTVAYSSVVPLTTIVSTGNLVTVSPTTFQMTFTPGIYKVNINLFVFSDMVLASTNSRVSKYNFALQKVSDSSVVITTPDFLNPTNAQEVQFGVNVAFARQINLTGILVIPASAASTLYRILFSYSMVVGGPLTANTSSGNIVVYPFVAEFTRVAYTP